MIQYASCNQLEKGHRVAFAFTPVCKNRQAELLQEPSGEVAKILLLHKHHLIKIIDYFVEGVSLCKKSSSWLSSQEQVKTMSK